MKGEASPKLEGWDSAESRYGMRRWEICIQGFRGGASKEAQELNTPQPQFSHWEVKCP